MKENNKATFGRIMVEKASEIVGAVAGSPLDKEEKMTILVSIKTFCELAQHEVMGKGNDQT